MGLDCLGRARLLGLGMLGILVAAVGPRGSRPLTGFDNQATDLDPELLSRLDEELDRLE